MIRYFKYAFPVLLENPASDRCTLSLSKFGGEHNAAFY